MRIVPIAVISMAMLPHQAASWSAANSRRCPSSQSLPHPRRAPRVLRCEGIVSDRAEFETTPKLGADHDLQHASPADPEVTRTSDRSHSGKVPRLLPEAQHSPPIPCDVNAALCHAPCWVLSSRIVIFALPLPGESAGLTSARTRPLVCARRGALRRISVNVVGSAGEAWAASLRSCQCGLAHTRIIPVPLLQRRLTCSHPGEALLPRRWDKQRRACPLLGSDWRSTLTMTQDSIDLHRPDSALSMTRPQAQISDVAQRSQRKQPRDGHNLVTMRPLALVTGYPGGLSEY